MSTRYLHQEAVGAYTSYIRLLHRAQPEPSWTLRIPPPDGWPQITKEGFACDGTTDAALEFMRHIPQWEDDGPEFMPKLRLKSNIEQERIEKKRKRSEEMRQNGSFPQSAVPAHLVCLGSNLGEVEYWFSVYLDTKHGVVLVEQVDFKLCPDLGIPQCSDPAIVEDEDYEVPETIYSDEEMEMHYELYDIKPFFQACEQKLRSLEWCPSFRERSLVQEEGALLDKKAMEERRKIIREAGWPAETWKKDVARWMIRELDGEMDLDAEDILKVSQQ